jgi:hypothetical protein
VATNAWTAKTGMPLTGSSGKKKKAKSGAAMGYQNGTIYAMKGGGTSEFWSYQCDSDKWTQQTDVPAGSGKPVKGGGAMVWAEMPYAFYVFKGNKTMDFFKYVTPTFGLTASSTKDNQMVQTTTPVTNYELSVSSNPFSGNLAVRYALPRAGNVIIRVYDVGGRVVSTLAQGYVGSGWHTATFDARDLARGIYVLKFETSGCNRTQKLILQ